MSRCSAATPGSPRPGSRPAGVPATRSISRWTRWPNSPTGSCPNRWTRRCAGHALPVPDAETAGPALLIQHRVAESYGADRLRLVAATLRDGVLREMAMRGQWSGAFIEQIERSAIELGHKYHFVEAHARHVASLSRALFEALQAQHRLGKREEVLLHIAALLHEIGLFISSRAHHKHSYYLIENSELFGLSRAQTRLVALVARYHRRATPRDSHPGYSELDRADRVRVAKLAAILRVADSLERSHTQRIRDIRARVEGDRLVVEVPQVRDFTLEQLALKQKGDLLEDIFGLTVALRGV